MSSIPMYVSDEHDIIMFKYTSIYAERRRAALLKWTQRERLCGVHTAWKY